MPVTHQDDFIFAPHPIDMLERTVEDNGWAFERNGKDELNLSVAGKWSDHHFSFSWREDLKSLHLTSTFDMRVTEDVRRQNVADLLMYVNARLWIGHFGIEREDGNPVFRHAVLLRGAPGASAESLEDMIDIAITECERFFPAFQFVLWGGKPAAEALDAAMLDCVGEA